MPAEYVPSHSDAMGLRYHEALERNLAELQHALLERTTMRGMERAAAEAETEGNTSDQGISSVFLQVCYCAVFNDYIAHCIKVFEKSGETATFWFIYCRYKLEVDQFASAHGIDFNNLEFVRDKLKKIRDKTHFHIDRKNSFAPKLFWEEADLAEDVLFSAIESAWSILTHLGELARLTSVRIPSYYTVEHTEKIARALEGGLGLSS